MCLANVLMAENNSKPSGLVSFMPHEPTPFGASKRDTSINRKEEAISSSIKIPTLPKAPDAVHHELPTIKPSEEKAWIPESREPEKATPETSAEIDAFNKAKVQEEKEQKIFLNFENATLQTVVEYIQDLFDVTFLPDDIIKPLIQNGGTLEGHKLSFKSNRGLSHEEVWNIFVRFIDMAGLVLYPSSLEKTYRITAATGANQKPLPIYFDEALSDIPDNPGKVRYVYYVKNNSMTTLQNIITSLASSSALIETFSDLNAIIITDKGSNIRSLMQIIKELDSTAPEAMSIIKLKSTDAQTVAKLYQDLISAENPQNRFGAGQKKQPSVYFPVNARIIPEPRTNCLIILGSQKAIDKIENFIIQYIDTELETPFSPLHTYQLQYTKAQDIAGYLSSVLSFGQGSTAAQYGGIRDGNAYFQSVTITPEPTSNSLIVRSSKEDYKKLEEIIKILDVEQPQVAIEVLIFDVSTTDTKQLGAQIRNSSEGSLGKFVNFQSSGIGGVVTNQNDNGLLGNLISLATGSANAAGTTLLSIKNIAGDVWALFRVLQTYVDTRIIANPFLISTNKYQASLSFGSTRRVQTAQVGANTSSFGDVKATLDLAITPHINNEGLINMTININMTDFQNENDSTSADTFTKQITTAAQVCDGQVIVLGGITKNTVSETITKVPLLGDIPLVGNLFRSKSKANVRTNLLVFISPRIIRPSMDYPIDPYSQEKNKEIKHSLDQLERKSVEHDPINRFFFNNGRGSNDLYESSINAFMNTPISDKKITREPIEEPIKESMSKRRLNKRKRKKV